MGSLKITKMKQIHVFKTSVADRADIARLTPVLNGLIGQHERWNFDLEDIDNILRVETTVITPSSIIDSLMFAGFECAELEG